VKFAGLSEAPREKLTTLHVHFVAGQLKKDNEYFLLPHKTYISYPNPSFFCQLTSYKESLGRTYFES
jgi:hypothetical protein